MNQLPRIYKLTANHRHKNETESIPLLMNTLKNCKRGEMKRIESETGVNYNTLKDWKRKLKDDPNFTPCHHQIRPNKRIFTIEEENNINCIMDYDEKRQKGENDSYICTLIRNDLIDEFIVHVNKTNISLSSTILGT